MELSRFLIEKKREIVPEYSKGFPASAGGTSISCSRSSVMSDLMRDEPPKRQLKDVQGGNLMTSKDFQAVVFQPTIFKEAYCGVEEVTPYVHPALPWKDAPTIRPLEKRHSVGGKSEHIFQNFEEGGESNVMQRMRQRFSATDRREVFSFVDALFGFSRHYDYEGKMDEYFVSKSSLISALKEIGLFLNHQSAEKLWNDVTNNGRKNIILPEYVATLFGISMKSQEYASLRESHITVPEVGAAEDESHNSLEDLCAAGKEEIVSDVHADVSIPPPSFFRDRFMSIVATLR